MDYKPYVIRALHAWCTDYNLTPYLVVWVDDRVSVPMAYVQGQEIVLNISYGATHELIMGNETISFSARFGGVSHDLWIPVGNVLSIFARETNVGMRFELSPPDDHALEQHPVESAVVTPTDKHPPLTSPTSPKGGGAHLRIVK